ncbi:acetyl-CoA synthetase-like protein [Meira miltonrushii]|uniref:Acetyl-CoA synthetase-like protein n=1 Tax=Meira miltonrushii TaxID=1280837 RepID=A0A316VF37_9BASI|nr:acetyl-CoA synthetase-like protein [Meira miltonrushii]PWN36247.1 acetyl-CoA synthetase-like protein [Meira miltonrushii]
MAYDLIPFPDLTGLRTTAHDRHTSTTHVQTQKVSSVSLQELNVLAGRLVPDRTYQDVIIAISLVILTHLLSPEDECSAQIAVKSQDDDQITLQQLDTTRQSRRTLQLAPLIQQTKRFGTTDNSTTTGTDNAILFCSKNQSGSVENHDSFKDAAFMLIVEHHDQGRILLRARASPRNHTVQSADLHLSQIDALLKSICDAGDQDDTPIFSTNRFDRRFLASDNEKAQLSSKQIISGDVKTERFEYQFEKMAEKQPNHVALEFRASTSYAAHDAKQGNISMTYSQVNEAASQIEQAVRSHIKFHKEAKEGHKVVALFLEKSRWTYIAILAVLKAGAAWCPIDTDWPSARRKALLAKSGASIVLSAGEKVKAALLEDLPEGMEMIDLENLRDSKAIQGSNGTARGSSSDDLAYLIWTSGTTGLPKAVGIQHKAAVQALRSLQEVIPHDDEKSIRYLQFSAYNFDLMILDMFYTWGLGGTLISSTRATLLTDLIGVANATQATHTLLTPAVMAMTPRESIPSLSVVINGGEKLSQTVADIWSEDCCLLNLYGPAEATLIAMNRRVPSKDVVKAPNIGRALPTTSCFAIDAEDNLVIKGAVGQLALGGFQCALGYIGDEAKTNEKFQHHPTLGRVYKTGDMVRQLHDGEFEYLGRVDDQVKVNGIRIELLEINATVRSSVETIKDSETLLISAEGAHQDTSEAQIVNFSVVPSIERSDAQLIRLDEEAIQIASAAIKFAQSHLPTYMVPSLFLIVNHFPKTSSAKVDREALKSALREVDVLDWQNRLASSNAVVSKETEEPSEILQSEDILREKIAAICLIDESKVGRYTPFPQMGLDSIRAITLAKKLNAIGMQVSVVDILNHSTLEKLALRIQSNSINSVSQEDKACKVLENFDQALRPTITSLFGKVQIERILPCTPLQESLIAETLQDPARYWLHRVYSLPEKNDFGRVQEAVNKVVCQIEALRIAFVDRHALIVKDALPRTNFAQVVLKDVKVRMLELQKSVDANEEVIAMQSARVHNIKILDETCPTGFTYVKHAGKVVMHIHHALYDQISLQLIDKALDKAWCGVAIDDIEPLSKAIPSIVDLDESTIAERKRAWQDLLSQCPKGEMITPPKLSMLEIDDFGSSIESRRSISSIKYANLAKKAQEFGTSARPILQTALAFVLGRLCDTEQIMLGDVVSGRAISSHLDNVVGPILATMAVPIPLHAASTSRTIWDQVSQFHIGALPHAHFSLGQIRQILDLPRTSETFHAVFAFEPPADIETSDHEPAIKAIGNYGIAVEHSLAIEMEVDQTGNLAIVLNTKKGMVDTALAEQFLDELESAILQLVKCPDAPLSSIELGKDGRIESISRFQIPESIVEASQLPCYTRFYQHCETNPDSIAVEFHERIERPLQPSLMSYSQLLQKSQKLAQLLLANVPTKSVVAVTIPRSFDSYVALLAILQAGCVYLPIDVALPDQRKEVLLRESKARCLLCHTDTAWIKQTDESNEVQVIRMNKLYWQQTPCQTKMPKVNMQDPAYILFTSGSTGVPKGCVLSHENLSAALASFRCVYDEFAPGSFDKDVRFLARSIESFDVALLETLLPLQSGATIVTAPRHVILSDLGKAMQNFEVTHAAVVPSLFYIEGRRVLPSDLPNLRALIVGGERLPKDILTNWSSSSVPLLNAYGPTEACIGTSIAKVRPNLSTGNVGKPFGSTQYVVLKKRSEGLDWSVAMRGEPGELCIAGLQVGQYLSQIVSNAFIEWREHRLYRTGDEVFMWPDDSIEYIGRIHGDTQVKVRGVRIELGEIDHVISQKEKDIRTITRYLSHSNHKHQIVMFAALSTSSTRSDEMRQLDSKDGLTIKNRLIKRCRDSLPSYMVPSTVVTLNYIPLAAISGKFDVKRLTAWYNSQGDIDQVYSEDTQSDNESLSRDLTDVEQIVKSQLTRMFDVGQSKLKLSTDLFALGLDSLNIIALCGALHRSDLQIDISDAIANPSVQGIAKHCKISLKRHESERMANSSRWEHLTVAARKAVGKDVNVEYALPCLPLQASMVSQTLLEFQQWQETPNENFRPRYVNVSRFKASSVQVGSAKKVKEAFQSILSRHSIYRTAFVEADDQIVQAVLDASDLNEVNIKEDEEWEEAAVRSLAENMHCCSPLRYRIIQESQSQDIYLDFVIHHALYDGVSLNALFEELSLYLASVEGAIRVNSTNFAGILEDVEEVKMEDRLQYWQSALHGCSTNFFPCLTGYQINQQQQEFDQVRSRLKTPLSNIQLQAKEKKATVAMLILHAFAELYSKYVGESDVTIGLVLNGRSSETEIVHGPCVNTVPFRYKHEKEDDAIQQVRHSYAQALQYQHVSLADLARHFEAPNGLFNTLFSFSGTIAEKEQKAFEEIHSNMLTEYPFAIEVALDLERDEVEVLIAFNTTFIPHRQVELFIAQLDSVLNRGKQIGGNVDLATEELSIQNLDADKVTFKHFVDMFSEQVDLRPQEVAFAFTEKLEDLAQTCTYDELNKVSDIIASNLNAFPGDIVGVHMSQCAEVYSLLVGIWKAGKTYLPLDPKLPADRLDYIVSVTKPSTVVVLDKSTVHSLFKSSSIIPYSEACSKAFNHQGNALKPRALDDLAYIMFTSGSSGKPKGVEISHRALAAALRSWKEILPHTLGKSRMLQLASPGFDVFLIEVCMPLALGFSFASAPKEILLDDLEKTFHRLQLTMADLPAALATTVHPSNLPKLEWLMSGGEQMDQRVIDAWSTTGLINAWGPTEATIGNTLGFVEQGRNRNWIGYAYPTSSLYILQPDSQAILPRGCIGEIAVGGPQLANGYYGNPTLTAEKFIDVLIPGQREGKVRLYRTGDRGRILSDGSIECHGRIEGDGQVKINSQRVELEEIEVALKRQKGITNASVLYLEHPKIRSHQLVAFLTANTGLLNGSQDFSDQIVLLKNERQSAELSQQCLTSLSQSLPAYMVPQHCFILASASLPLTPNNKVDTRRLKAFYATLEPNSFGHAASNTQSTVAEKPMTKTEARLRSLIAEFAGVSESEIGRQTSLYRFGIDSISGLRLARFLRDRGVKGIRAQVIFASPTVASIAASIEKSHMTNSEMKDDVRVTLPDELQKRLGQDGNFEAFPCTPLQNGMLLESLVKEGSLYLLHQAFRFESELSERVQNAVAVLHKHHEVLRSSFHLVDGQFVQIIRQDAAMHIDLVEKEQHVSEQNSIRRIQKQHRIMLAEEHGLESGPFLVSIIKGEKDSHLILTLHHALYDGESLGMLIRDLKQLVGSRMIHKVGPQYRDILPTLLPSPQAADFWVQRLLNRQDSLFPKSASRSLDSHSISSDMSIQPKYLARFARDISVSVHTIALYSYAKLLAKLTGQLCVTFAEIFSLRNNTELEGSDKIFGPCFNTILTSIQIREDELNIDALQRLQSEVDQGREYRNASLADIQRGLIRSRGNPCKIDALFNMQVLIDQPIIQDNNLILLQDLEDNDFDAGQYALNVEFVQQGDRFSLVVKAHKECFSKLQLSETAKDFESILEFIMQNADAISTEMPSHFNSLAGLRSGLIEINTKQSPILDGKQISLERVGKSPIQTLMFDTIGAVLQINAASISSQTILSGIGLDSIASMHLATRLRKKGIKIGVADINQGRTVDGIMAKMQSREDGSEKATSNGELQKMGEEKSRIASIAEQTGQSAKDIEASLPILPGQFFELIQGGETGLYIFAYQYRNGAKLSLERLQKAWYELQNRHSILRTSFFAEDDSAIKWDQIVSNPDSTSPSKIDTHTIQKPFMKAIKENGLNCFTADFRVPLQPGLCPAGLSLVHSPEGDVLLLRLHHALYDAWSLPILMEDLGRLYDEGTLNDVPDYTAYVRHVTQQRRKLVGAAQDYWKKLLNGQPVARIPSRSVGDGKSFMFIQNAVTNVRRREKRLNGSYGGLPALIMASWATMLTFICEPSNAKTSTFGLYLTGRNESFDGIERMTGNLTNIVPVVASMEETNRCLYDTSKSVLLRLANQIKTQLDEHSHLDSFTSIKDVLDWTENDVIPWNSTLNLLWHQGDRSLNQKEEESAFTMIEDLLTRPYEKTDSKFERSSGSIDAYANVQIDIQSDPKSDALHLGIKWDNALWSSSQVDKIMHDFCQLIRLGSEESG